MIYGNGMEAKEYSILYKNEESHWWPKSKRELVLFRLGNSLGKKGNVLDFGCGSGKMLEELDKKGFFCLGLDSSKIAVKFCRQRGVKAFLADFQTLNKKYFKCFDAVLALDVLEHIKDEGKALSCIKKFLKNSGMLVITVPAFQWLFSNWDTMLHHYRRYDKKTIIQLLERNGFKVQKSFYWCSFLFPAIALVRLLRRKKNLVAKSDFEMTPQFLNGALLWIMRFENWMHGKGLHLPFGTSVFVQAVVHEEKTKRVGSKAHPRLEQCKEHFWRNAKP